MAPVNRSDGISDALNIFRRQSDNLHINRKEPAEDANTGTPVGVGRVDQFEPSSVIDEINRLKEDIKQIPDVNEEKVAALREEIRNGTFTIDPHQVAQKILESGIKPESR